MTTSRKLVLYAAGGLLAAAIAKEWAQPRGMRVGEGRVLGIPYSLRLLNTHDLRERYWNAATSPLAPPLFGVGVVPNMPALARKLGLV